MIRFNLRCRKEHVFEAWFPDGGDYERQAADGKLACPACGSSKIEKAPMAPSVAKSGRAERAAEESRKAGEIKKALAELRKKVEENCDYVGPEFAEEALKIHFGETEKRNIYGEASDEEEKRLKDEGISFGRIPWAPRES
ncbi:MAG: DUF1178 family protein [Kiloniellales bacterium]